MSFYDKNKLCLLSNFLDMTCPFHCRICGSPLKTLGKAFLIKTFFSKHLNCSEKGYVQEEENKMRQDTQNVSPASLKKQSIEH